MIKYRHDIDGLRALAVLAVVFFHIDSSLVPGGFIGVDIFFVISGFLITGIISQSVGSGSFSFKEFYRRRIKRIIPVLTAVILVTLIAAQFILLPEDLQSLSISAIASQLFVANIYFTYFLDTSYFADDAALQPLLHLWSLGVEEQFYLLWPLTLVLGLRYLKQSALIALVLVLAVISFVGGEFLLDGMPMFAYYMLPSRAGELFVGAMCFFATQGFTNRKFTRIGLESISWAGMGLVCFSLIYLSEDKGFPGLNAIPVTAGTALLIFAGSQHSTFLSRLLSWRPIVGIGLISYSMYLWHWPLLAFVKYIYVEPTGMQKAISFIAIVLLSVLSYELIEKPFKADKSNFASVFVRQFGAPTVLIVLLCGLLIVSKGFGIYSFDQAYRAELQLLSQQAQPSYKFRYVCQDYRLSLEELASKECIIGGRSEPKVLLWGDSNAAYFVGVLGVLAKQYGFSFRNAVHSSCPPLMLSAQEFVPDRLKQNCAISNSNVSSIVDNYDVVVLAGAWNTYFRKTGDEFKNALQTTVEELSDRGKLVVLLGRAPAINSFDRKCTLKSLKMNFIDCAERMKTDRKTVQAVNSKVEAIAIATGARYFDVSEVLCTDDSCSAILDGQLVYHDAGHLSMDGSILIGSLIQNSEQSIQVFSDFPQHTGTTDIVLLPWEQDQHSWLDDIDEARLVKLMSKEELMQPSNWRGNAPQKSPDDGSLRFSDNSVDSFQSAVLDFGPKLYAMNEKNDESNYLLLELKFKKQNLNFPMIRLTLERESPIKIDFRIDGNLMEMYQRNPKGWVPSALEVGSDSIILKIGLPATALNDGLKLGIFPAASDLDGGYAKKFKGAFILEDLSWYLVGSKKSL